MGAWIEGQKYGLTLKGKDYGLFVEGKTYITDNLIKRTKTNNNETTTTYAVFSYQNEISTKGKEKLNNGKNILYFQMIFQSTS